MNNNQEELRVVRVAQRPQKTKLAPLTPLPPPHFETVDFSPTGCLPPPPAAPHFQPPPKKGKPLLMPSPTSVSRTGPASHLPSDRRCAFASPRISWRTGALVHPPLKPLPTLPLHPRRPRPRSWLRQRVGSLSRSPEEEFRRLWRPTSLVSSTRSIISCSRPGRLRRLRWRAREGATARVGAGAVVGV